MLNYCLEHYTFTWKVLQYYVFYYRCTILFDRDGNTISSAGEWQSSDEDICAAVAANIWLTLERASRGNPNQVNIIKHNSEYTKKRVKYFAKCQYALFLPITERFHPEEENLARLLQDFWNSPYMNSILVCWE